MATALNHGLESEHLLNEHDVARITGMHVGSVRRWRLFQTGPRFLKIGSAVRYRPADIAAWLDSRPSGGGQQEAQEMAVGERRGVERPDPTSAHRPGAGNGGSASTRQGQMSLRAEAQ
jgi:predicted DNA-binding transcriptional regulator AlpA